MKNHLCTALRPAFWLLSLLLFYSANPQASVRQLNSAQCAQLSLKLQQNQDAQRRGYSRSEEVKLTNQQAQLELQLAHYCQQPQDDSPRHGVRQKQNPKKARAPASKAASEARTSASQRATPANTSANQPTNRQVNTAANTAGNKAAADGWQVSTLVVKAPYQGAQLDAWLQFYQAPFYCYGVRHTERIRQCVEQRQQAQRQFEQRWQQPPPTD